MKIKVLVIDKENNDLFFIMEGDEGVKDVLKKAVQDLLILNKISNDELTIREDCVFIKVPFKQNEENFIHKEHYYCKKVDIIFYRLPTVRKIDLNFKFNY